MLLSDAGSKLYKKYMYDATCSPRCNIDYELAGCLKWYICRAEAHSLASQAMARLVFVIGASAKVAIIILGTGPISIVY